MNCVPVKIGPSRIGGLQSPAAAESDVDSIKAGSIEVGQTLDGVSGGWYDGCEGPQPSRNHRLRASKSAIQNPKSEIPGTCAEEWLSVASSSQIEATDNISTG